MKKQNSLKLDPSVINSRLALCAAALAGTAAALPSADATIVTFVTPYALPNPFDGTVPATLAGVYIDLGTGATAGASFANFDFNPYLRNAGTIGFYWGTGAGGVAVGTVYSDLAPGTTIGPASVFTATIAGTVGSPFVTTGTHILGFRFTNEATGMVDYGYMVMTNSATSGFPTTILSWSYDNTGAPITIPVPEPSTIALLSVTALALGALGLREWRRQRAA